MAIIAFCSKCNVRLTLGDDRAGDVFECPRCETPIRVPGAAGPPGDSRPPPLPGRRAVSPPPLPAPEPGRRADWRVRAGLLAGCLGLLAAGGVAAVFAVRQPGPAEAVAYQPEPPPPAAVVPPPVVPVVGPPKVEPPSPPPQVGPPPRPAPSGDQYNAQFLGSQGQGRRFCIIADNSGSMTGPKLADLKKQLLKTLSDLDQRGEFYVYFFNSRADPMPHPGWLKAGAPEAEKVRDWVGSMRATGGTLPAPAFEAAFRLDPRPDVLFFMTDGFIPPTVPDRVAALSAAGPKVKVNTILFAAAKDGALPTGVAGRPEDVLKRIAEQNGGTFTRYVAKD